MSDAADDADLEQLRGKLLAGIEAASTPEDLVVTVQAVLDTAPDTLVTAWVDRLARSEANLELGAGQATLRAEGSAASDARAGMPQVISGAFGAGAELHATVEILATGEVGRPMITVEQGMALTVMVTAFQPYFAGLGLSLATSHALAMIMAMVFLFGYRHSADK